MLPSGSMFTYMRFNTYGITDIGKYRKNNEDAIIIGESICTDGILETEMSPPFFAAVCDGVGGEKSGEIASSFTLEKLLMTTYSKVTELKTRVFGIHDELIEYGREHPESFNMQTTLCLVAFDAENNISCINVGDSRAYLFKSGRLKQISTDQSLSEFLNETGRTKIFEHDSEKIKHVIISSLGNSKQYPMVDLTNVSEKLEPGDILMVCSDGVSDKLSGRDIEASLSGSEPISKKAKNLIDKALEKGSRDNLSVILIEVQS